MVFLPSTRKEYEYNSPVRGSEVKLHTPPGPSRRSAMPGASYMSFCPFISYSTGLVGRKSPVTCTVTALGANRRNVTVLSGLISGDTRPVPGPRACWAKAASVRQIKAKERIIRFIMWLFSANITNTNVKSLLYCSLFWHYVQQAWQIKERVLSLLSETNNPLII